MPKYDFQWDEALIARYAVQGPRYTSYPTALEFKPIAPSLRTEYLQKYAQSESKKKDAPWSVYIHVPFCQKLCYFCACNKIITRDRNRATEYLVFLKKEIQRTAENLNHKTLTQLHFGGGTPNFLHTSQMADLLSCIKNAFDMSNDAQISIEMDPRSLSLAKFDAYLDLGFNRLSFGVQDTNVDVQKHINRDQSKDLSAEFVEAARKRGIESIHLDLIYGLPAQNEKTFTKTIEDIIALSPERLSVFNFAYLPDRFPSQKLLDASLLPDPKTRLLMLKNTGEALSQAGYRFVGMDHFAKAGDALAKAQDAHELGRNFQGYTTHAENNLLAFGVSAISEVGAFMSQNHKSIDDYQNAVDKGIDPVALGLEKTEEDMRRARIIQELLCHFSLNYTKLSHELSVDFKTHYQNELMNLKKLEDDGLLVLGQNDLEITPQGRLLVRAVAMIFDAYLGIKNTPNTLASSKGFSKII